MTFSSLFRTVRHPAAIALRLVLWPTLVMALGDLASRTEGDALGSGLMAFAGIVVASCVLALADGLVLRTRPLLLVWSITTVVVAGLVTAQPLIDFLVRGQEGDTWAEMVRMTVEDLPSSIVFFLFLVGVPVTAGALTGSVLRRSLHLGEGHVSPAAGLGVPRA
jgi:hypothetical protein